MKNYLPFLCLFLGVSMCVFAGGRAEGGFKYRVKGKEGGIHAEIVKYTGKENSVAVPAEINGLAVTVIRTGAFAWNKDVAEVTVPESVRRIRKQSFQFCKNLEKINIPGGDIEVEGGAFWPLWNFDAALKEDMSSRFGKKIFSFPWVNLWYIPVCLFFFILVCALYAGLRFGIKIRGRHKSGKGARQRAASGYD
jgi:hypothetical protein